MKRQPNSTTLSKLNPKWVKQTLREFREFLQRTNFPDPVRNGTRGSYFNYPEWLIMFIAVLSVKAKVKSYLGIHRLATEYWSLLTPEPNLKPISESQLRDRLKKIRHTPGKPAGFISQLFSAAYLADG
jgi:hypothetical protein